MKINIISFGQKYHDQIKCDVLIDARSLINPYYQNDLKNINGLDNRVLNFILKDSYTSKYIDSIINYINIYIEGIKAKKEEITIGVKCTGGMHRSVFLAEILKNKIKEDVKVTHLDIIG